MWQAVQISIAGISAVMAGILLLYCTVRITGSVSDRIQGKNKADE